MPTGTAATSAAPAGTARERLLAAADELFYAEGIHTVGIDRIIERAGVAKASLYSTFGSKDALVRAYLEARLEARKGRIARALDGLTDPRERLLAVFDSLAAWCARPGFNGCAFNNASAEAHAGSAEAEVTATSRAYQQDLFAELAGEAGARDPQLLARQLVQLYDGAMSAARMDHDLEAAAVAKVTAGTLLDAATAAR